MKKITITSLTAAALAMPAASFAQPTIPTTGTAGGGEGVRPIITIIDRVANWMYAILLSVAAIYILLAAFKYLTSKGDAKAIGDAKQALIYSLVAVAIAALTGGLIAVAKNIAGGVLQ